MPSEPESAGRPSVSGLQDVSILLIPDKPCQHAENSGLSRISIFTRGGLVPRFEGSTAFRPKDLIRTFSGCRAARTKPQQKRNPRRRGRCFVLSVLSVSPFAHPRTPGSSPAGARPCAPVQRLEKRHYFCRKKKEDFSFVFTLDIKKTRILKILFRRLFLFFPS